MSTSELTKEQMKMNYEVLANSHMELDAKYQALLRDAREVAAGYYHMAGQGTRRSVMLTASDLLEQDYEPQVNQ